MYITKKKVIELYFRYGIQLEYKKNKNTYPFYDLPKKGKTIFLGEGNFSFALDIAKNNLNYNQNILATDIKEDYSEEETKINILSLVELEVDVLLGIDATRLKNNLGKFDFVIFQFPHSGSREPIENRHSNFILIRDFLNSVKNITNLNSHIIITIVDTEYYQRAFSIDEALEITGYQIIETYNFVPSKFIGYNHIMTNSNESAIENYNNFITLELKRKT